MPTRPSDDELTDKALAALEETMQEVSRLQGPIRHKRALRLALAYLYLGGDRRPFVNFWQSAVAPQRDGRPEVMAINFGRVQSMRCALAAICRLHGRDPY